jgi:hypothetical protein
MSKAVEFAQAAAIAAPRRKDAPFELAATGLVPLRAPTWTEWEEVGEWLKKVDGALQWWIGDWLRIGEGEFGEKYAQAVDATGWEIKTVQQYQWVCERVAFERRIPGLSFFHHREVADLEPAEQTEWLEKASRGDGDGQRWSVARLRDELNARNGNGDGVWVLVQAKDQEDADSLVERMIAEGRKAKVRGAAKRKDEGGDDDDEMEGF